jgi:membrane-bound metal-dependent hydrolase YbcI (DUF457 family)
MLLEHIIYTTAIAIIVGMIYSKKVGRDPSWIIIGSTYMPDLDYIADSILKKIKITLLFYGNPIEHGYFHNFIMLFIVAFFTALCLQMIGVRFIDSFLCSSIGFGAHLIEDALVFNPGYAFFWPISTEKYGIGLVAYNADLFGIANLQVLFIGLTAITLSAIIRTIYEGTGWIKRMLIPNHSYFINEN